MLMAVILFADPNNSFSETTTTAYQLITSTSLVLIDTFSFGFVGIFWEDQLPRPETLLFPFLALKLVSIGREVSVLRELVVFEVRESDIIDAELRQKLRRLLSV